MAMQHRWRSCALCLISGEPVSAAFIPTNAADYEERTIKALPAEQACAMAMLVLAGYKFNCGMLTNAGNRWWNVRDPAGKHMSATGGMALIDVVNRVWRQHDYSETYRRAATGAKV